ncbi:MAG TPA: hypothetical protein VGO03_09255 [Acidimicrobiia bacterium]|jgi:hypothetical protein
MQELGSGDTRHRPIALGGALVTVVEPRRGQEVAYNRWYERDHFYAGCMIGAWTVQGGRYVATKDLKALRYPLENDVIPDPTSGSYVAIYWILAGKFAEWMEWGTAQVKWLHENGRMFTERDHIHTVMYKYRSRYEREDGVPVELALDHRSPYCVLFVGEPMEGIGLDDIDGYLARYALPYAVAAEFTPVPLLGDAPSDVPRSDGGLRFTVLWFVDDDLPALWDSTFAKLGSDLEAAGIATTKFCGPFRATIPGTDTYTDQLW